MRLNKRLNILSLLVVVAILITTAFAYFATYNIFREFDTVNKEAVQRLNVTIYALIAISALVAASGVLIFRALIHGIPNFIEEINNFTKSMIHEGAPRTKLKVKGADEFTHLVSNLNRLADSYKEKIHGFESAMAKRQKAVRELAILNELMGFITSEIKLDIILKNLVERTKDLVKSDFCAAVIFECDTFNTRVYVTCDGIQDPSAIKLSPDGIFSRALKEKIPIRISSEPSSTGTFREGIKIQELDMDAKDLLAVPLTSSSKLTGLLLLVNKADGTYDNDDEDILMNFTFQAFQTIAMHEEITNLAVTDGLTNLNNHRNFQERLSEEAEKAKRYGRNLSLLIADVDNFKNFNDIYGHQVGDMVLRTIASIIKEQVRITDFCARYGGEEFAVIMPETAYNGAKILAERLRKKVSTTPFELPNNEKALITISVGFAALPENAKDKLELVEMADRALYFAKEHGRNLSFGYNENLRIEYNEREEDIRDTFENLANVIDSRSPYTKGHSAEVAKFATLLAQKAGLPEDDIESIRIASVLHDVGTLNIPETVLNKPGGLNEEEIKIIKAHPQLAEMVLKKYPQIQHVLPIILYHHERYDGKGYPTGISGQEIPLEARILSIAEAYHAMISHRPYKEKKSIDEAINELKTMSGTQFDPKLVKLFIDILNSLDNA